MKIILTDMLDVMSKHHLMKDLASSLSNEPEQLSAMPGGEVGGGRDSYIRLVHIILATNQRLYVVIGGRSVERRARFRSCLTACWCCVSKFICSESPPLKGPGSWETHAAGTFAAADVV